METKDTSRKQYKLKEVCIRLAEGHPLYSDVPLSSPATAMDVMQKELSQYDREVLCVVNLNNKLKPINFNIVSVGNINGSIAAIPNILKSAILSNAAGFILLHNHPSGDVMPFCWKSRKAYGYPMYGSCDCRREWIWIIQLQGVRNGGFYK